MGPEPIADYACEIGEGPLWHPLEKRLYWGDIPQGKMFRYDPATGLHEQFYDGPVVGGFTIQANGSLLLFMEKGAIAVWRDGDLDYIIDALPGEEENRFNDVFADPRGRVFCGTMPMDPERGAELLGTLYLLDTDASIKPVLHDLGISNGMGLTPDRKQMYFTDTIPKTIYRFDYAVESGALSNRQVFVDSSDEEGGPDGMTVDAEGYVWSARWGGACVTRYSPDGVGDRRITYPTGAVSSAIFGGDDYSDLYATTAMGNDKSTNGEHAGALFRVDPGVKGVAEFFSKVGL
jgi:sugar lactone lactonase YvrE